MCQLSQVARLCAHQCPIPCSVKECSCGRGFIAIPAKEFWYSCTPNLISYQGVLIWEMPNTMLEGGSGLVGLKLFCPGQNFQFSTIYGNIYIYMEMVLLAVKTHIQEGLQVPVEGPTSSPQ